MNNKLESTRTSFRNMLRRKSKENDKLSVLKHSNEHSETSSVGSRNLQWLPLGKFPTRFTENSFRSDDQHNSGYIGFSTVYNDSLSTDISWSSQNVNEPPIDYEDVFQQENNKLPDQWGKNDNSESTSSSYSSDIHPFRRIFLRFADKTSMTGVPFIKNATLPVARFIWAVLFLGAVGATIFHLTFLFDQYYSYPKQTKVSLGFSNLPIPAVTICNINPIKKSELHLASRDLQKLITFSDPKRFEPKDDDNTETTTKPTPTTRKEKHERNTGGTVSQSFDINMHTTVKTARRTQINRTGRGTGSTRPWQNTMSTSIPAEITSEELKTTQRNKRGRGTGRTRSTSQFITDVDTTTTPISSVSSSSNTESTDHTSSKSVSTTDIHSYGTSSSNGPETTTAEGISDSYAPFTNQESDSSFQSTSPPMMSTVATSFPFGEGTSTTRRQDRRRGTGRGSSRTRPTNSEISTVATLDGVVNRPRNRNRRFVDGLDNFNYTEDPVDISDKEDEIDSLTKLTKTFYKLYMNEPRSNRYDMGHKLADMLLQCSIGGKKCSQRSFKTFQTETYGNCFTFQSEEALIQEPGSLYGLQMILYLENDEYIHGITDGYGARVVIHDQNTVPFPSEEGFDIPAAFETSIGLKLLSIERLGGDYGNCTEKIQFYKTYGVHYTVKTCLTLCRAKYSSQKCGCVLEKDQEYLIQTNYTSYNICKTTAERRCLGFLKRKSIVRELPCECLQPCSEKQYTKFTSSRQFPSTEYASMLLQSVCEKSPRYCADLKVQAKDIRQLNMNFLRLKIYFEDLNYEKIEEEPEIGKAQFSSDVGGAIGLWIGLSILSLFEVIQLFVEILKYCFCRNQNTNELDSNTST